VLDDFSREGLDIEANLSLPTSRVICSMQKGVESPGKAEIIRYGSGLECISRCVRQPG